MANCYAVQDPRIQPAMRVISAITKAKNAEVTTTFDHDFSSDIIVRFYIPSWYGMQEIDRLKGTITVTGTDTFTVDIDTRKFSTFAVPADQWWHNKCAIIIPVTGTAHDAT